MRQKELTLTIHGDEPRVVDEILELSEQRVLVRFRKGFVPGVTVEISIALPTYPAPLYFDCIPDEIGKEIYALDLDELDAIERSLLSEYRATMGRSDREKSPMTVPNPVRKVVDEGEDPFVFEDPQSRPVSKKSTANEIAEGAEKQLDQKVENLTRKIMDRFSAAQDKQTLAEIHDDDQYQKLIEQMTIEEQSDEEEVMEVQGDSSGDSYEMTDSGETNGGGGEALDLLGDLSDIDFPVEEIQAVETIDTAIGQSDRNESIPSETDDLSVALDLQPGIDDLSRKDEILDENQEASDEDILRMLGASDVDNDDLTLSRLLETQEEEVGVDVKEDIETKRGAEADQQDLAPDQVSEEDIAEMLGARDLTHEDLDYPPDPEDDPETGVAISPESTEESGLLPDDKKVDKEPTNEEWLGQDEDFLSDLPALIEDGRVNGDGVSGGELVVGPVADIATDESLPDERSIEGDPFDRPSGLVDEDDSLFGPDIGKTTDEEAGSSDGIDHQADDLSLDDDIEALLRSSPGKETGDGGSALTDENRDDLINDLADDPGIEDIEKEESEPPIDSPSENFAEEIDTLLHGKNQIDKDEQDDNPEVRETASPDLESDIDDLLNSVSEGDSLKTDLEKPDLADDRGGKEIDPADELLGLSDLGDENLDIGRYAEQELNAKVPQDIDEHSVLGESTDPDADEVIEGLIDYVNDVDQRNHSGDDETKIEDAVRRAVAVRMSGKEAGGISVIDEPGIKLKSILLIVLASFTIVAVFYGVKRFILDEYLGSTSSGPETEKTLIVAKLDSSVDRSEIAQGKTLPSGRKEPEKAIGDQLTDEQEEVEPEPEEQIDESGEEESDASADAIREKKDGDGKIPQPVPNKKIVEQASGPTISKVIVTDMKRYQSILFLATGQTRDIKVVKVNNTVVFTFTRHENKTGQIRIPIKKGKLVQVEFSKIAKGVGAVVVMNNPKFRLRIVRDSGKSIELRVW